MHLYKVTVNYLELECSVKSIYLMGNLINLELYQSSPPQTPPYTYAALGIAGCSGRYWLLLVLPYYFS